MKNKHLLLLSLISSMSFAQQQGQVYYQKETKFDLSKAVGLPKGLSGMKIKAPSGKKDNVVVSYSGQKRLIETKAPEKKNSHLIMSKPPTKVLVDLEQASAFEYGSLMDVNFSLKSDIAAINHLAVSNEMDEVDGQKCQVGSIKSQKGDRDISVCFVPDEKFRIAPTAWLSSVPGKVLKVADGSVTYTYKGEHSTQLDEERFSVSEEFELITKVQYQDLQDEFVEQIRTNLPKSFKSANGEKVQLHTISISGGH